MVDKHIIVVPAQNQSQICLINAIFAIHIVSSNHIVKTVKL